MIPRKLTLKNFLSYREANLDFNGLHTACICGSNGAGKSSLLEAITWAVWGKSRMESEDDVIYGGEKNVRVDFEFISNGETYRIIRNRQRGKTASLDFQILGEIGFRTLTGRGKKNTQDDIISAIKLDYDTFINSAYLRQGKADEFMLCKPTKRKEILADLLKLSRYEQLSDKAKDVARQYQIQSQQLEKSLEPIALRCLQQPLIEIDLKNLKENLAQLQKNQTLYRERLQKLQAVEHQRQTWEQQFSWQEKQEQEIKRECDRLGKEITNQQQELTDLTTKYLNRECEINLKYQELRDLQKLEETLATKFEIYQEAQQKKQNLEKEQERERNKLELKIQETKTKIQNLSQQTAENQLIISQKPEIEAAIELLNHHRQKLAELDSLQQETAPLQQRQARLQSDLERVKQRHQDQIEQLQRESANISAQLSQVPQKRKEYLEASEKLKQLEKKKTYRDRLQEKGTEKKSFKQRLEERQQLCHKQLEENKQKLLLLQTQDASCPLCQQELGGDYRQLVINKTELQHNQLSDEIWNLSEQIRICEQELENLRAEFNQIKKELNSYDLLNNQLGQLEAQLLATEELDSKLEQIFAQIENLERSLTTNKYAEDLQAELNQLEAELQRLNYDEKTHHLAREEVKRRSKAEIQQATLEQTLRRQETIEQQQPLLKETLNNLTKELEQLTTNSPTQRLLQEVETEIAQIGYDRTAHNQVLIELRQAQSWSLLYQQLQQAQTRSPEIAAKLSELDDRLKQRLVEQAASQQQLKLLLAQREQIEDNREDIEILENGIRKQQEEINEALGKKGALEQSLVEIAHLQTQYQTNQEDLTKAQKQYKIYHELGQAFGKNGLQTLMIENILPYLEAESNQILARLTGNQLHVQFITQKAAKSTNAKNKMLDTLDIHIADNRGTRPYESYSGGEAFRINFAIRLALARLLAQRSGASLQMLIIDEGFGTQDEQGCDLLVAAINTISADFACILTVTHMPQFKEAFQNRIEVRKTNEGSKISLSA